MRIYLPLLLIAALNTLQAKKIESVQSGNWTAPSTWKNNIVPKTTDSVIINVSHEIQINKDSISAYYIELKGNLKFSNSYQLKTKIVECNNNCKFLSNYFIGSLQIDSLFWVKSNCEISNVNIMSRGLCNISGNLILSSETAKKEFENIYIAQGGKWNNDNNGDPKISGDIINNGTFISCKNTGCTYHFSNIINFLGDSTTSITRMNCAPSTSIVNSGKLHVLLSIDGNPILINKKTLTLSLSSLTFRVAQFNTSTSLNTVVYADTSEQEIFTPTNGYYENLVLKNGRKMLSQNLTIKQKLELKDSAILAQQTFAIKGMNNAILNIDSTSTLCIGSNDFETTQGFPTEFKQLNLHQFSTILYQSKKDEIINSQIAYGNLSIDDGAVNESIKAIGNDSLRVRGNLWIAESSVRLKCMNCAIVCEGDWNGIGNLEMQDGIFQLKGNGNNYGILYPGNGEIIYNGESNQVLKIGNYNRLRIQKNNGKAILKGNANTFICKKLINEKSLFEIGNETVTISDSLINKDILHFTSTQQTRSIKHVVNQTGASIVFKVAAVLAIKGNWTNLGSLSANTGKIIFADSVADQYINGKNLFNKIEINKLKKILHFNNDIKTQGEIKLVSGKINLKNYVLTLLSNSKIIDENNVNYIYGNGGRIIVNKTITANINDTINGLGLIIQPSSNWGNTVFIRRHSTYIIEGQESIKRQFEIKPSNNTNLNEKVYFYYLPHELGSNTNKNLALYKSEDEINWQNISATKDTTARSFMVSNIHSFSTWTFKNAPTNPLPVKWLETKINLFENTVFWSTASEENVGYFEVQTSIDGIHFSSIKSISACGTCNNTNEYFSKLPEENSFQYIRIKSTDNDGEVDYSKILEKQSNASNPRISINNKNMSVDHIESNSVLEMYDVQGNLILEQKINPNEKITLNFSDGIYFYNINQKRGKILLVN